MTSVYFDMIKCNISRQLKIPKKFGQKLITRRKFWTAGSADRARVKWWQQLRNAFISPGHSPPRKDPYALQNEVISKFNYFIYKRFVYLQKKFLNLAILLPTYAALLRFLRGFFLALLAILALWGGLGNFKNLKRYAWDAYFVHCWRLLAVGCWRCLVGD